MESKDYNPVLHERGFHEKLNLLVNESLQVGSLRYGEHDTTTKPNLIQPEVFTQSDLEPDKVRECKTPQPELRTGEDKPCASFAEEWEQLVVSEIPMKYSPICEPKRKWDKSVFSSPESNKQLDAKISRILERPEVLKQLKTKLASPTITRGVCQSSCVITKKPLIPLQPTNTRQTGPLVRAS